MMALPEIGTSGLPFGAGQFQQTADGFYDPATGRRWDLNGNVLQTQPPQAAPPNQGVVQAAQPSYVAGQQQTQQAAPRANSTLQQNQATADSILKSLPAPNKVNAAGFNKLPGSSKQFLLGGYAELGYDPNDLTEMWQRELPKVGGPKRGYVAGLGAN
jgi:hypothetical protein